MIPFPTPANPTLVKFKAHINLAMLNWERKKREHLAPIRGSPDRDCSSQKLSNTKAPPFP
jgi:hypothetical protein